MRFKSGENMIFIIIFITKQNQQTNKQKKLALNQPMGVCVKMSNNRGKKYYTPVTFFR